MKLRNIMEDRFSNSEIKIRQEKLKLHDRLESLKLIYQWVKQDKISINQFQSLLDSLYE